MATEIGEQTQLKANLHFVIKVVTAVGVCVWGYSVIWNRLASLDMGLERVQHESTLLGDLSARVQSLEKQADNVNHSVEQLLSMQDAPITSDHQQFERLKYLEKEMDVVRGKVDWLIVRDRR